MNFTGGGNCLMGIDSSERLNSRLVQLWNCTFSRNANLFFYNPNVSELKRVAVALQLHWSGSSFRFATGATGFSRNLEIVVNDDTIQANRDFGVFDLLPVFSFGVGKVGVVGLPSERRKAGIHASESLIE